MFRPVAIGVNQASTQNPMANVLMRFWHKVDYSFRGVKSHILRARGNAWK